MITESGQKLECVIRWIEEELKIIKGLSEELTNNGISINILEFFVVMYAIILWGKDFLKRKIIQINCDNTAAISWILKQRVSNKAPTHWRIPSSSLRKSSNEGRCKGRKLVGQITSRGNLQEFIESINSHAISQAFSSNTTASQKSTLNS